MERVAVHEESGDCVMDRERILKGLERHAITKYISTHETCPYKDIDICHHVLAEEAYKYISEQPQIVRCKDCKHRGTIICWMHYVGTTEDDWFCADGERVKE